VPDMIDRALSALTAAWVTTVIATAILGAAFAIAPVWNSAVYLRALPRALSLDPSTPIPEDIAVPMRGEPSPVVTESRMRRVRSAAVATGGPYHAVQCDAAATSHGGFDGPAHAGEKVPRRQAERAAGQTGW
jgi:hypothetical protein